MFNKVCFQGNMVRNPEYAQTRGDTVIVNFTIASTRKYKRKEETAFVDCTAYGQTADNIAKFFNQGDPIGVEGRLSQNQWTDQGGNKRSKIFITVDGFHFVGPTGDGQGGQRGGGNRGGGQNYGNQNQGHGGAGGNYQGGHGGGHQGGGGNYQNQNQGQGHGGGQGGGPNQYDDDIPF